MSGVTDTASCACILLEWLPECMLHDSTSIIYVELKSQRLKANLIACHVFDDTEQVLITLPLQVLSTKQAAVTAAWAVMVSANQRLQQHIKQEPDFGDTNT